MSSDILSHPLSQVQNSSCPVMSSQRQEDRVFPRTLPFPRQYLPYLVLRPSVGRSLNGERICLKCPQALLREGL
jgi:hypothetical protein